tara:strand:- start:5603 stop:5800 length:198 start_codon:yes stop_codon:yes gene_type:complete
MTRRRRIKMTENDQWIDTFIEELRCTTCARCFCGDDCNCGCHKMNMVKIEKPIYVQYGNGVVHIE